MPRASCLVHRLDATDLYEKLMRTIAPTVHGHDEIKKGLSHCPTTTSPRVYADYSLCGRYLVDAHGRRSKVLRERWHKAAWRHQLLLGKRLSYTCWWLRIRMPSCYTQVGDPSTAKSNFLKYVCSILPRAVYTSGKASLNAR